MDLALELFCRRLIPLVVQVTPVDLDMNFWVYMFTEECYRRCLRNTEFDFRVIGDGRSAMARYANNSNYRNDSLIRKESTSHPSHTKQTLLILLVCVSSLMISEIKRIIKDSEIMKEDDSKWPQKNKDGRQELEIRLGSDHISFEVGHVPDIVP